ncbi:tRNA pseudouridine(55) synthase TruB [Puniceicoccus vermicola]|uniref:tRNA pseudouridine synthase B n=1 Tax=Puniceicoccus vermicola TaxID=388746 RepID=A0A7X1AYI6_9BACT|nr:tRNA pseudouridine(55) synthase TruB [Puniceicoccus vermicola]MBC2602341.1 tRNA pseudouridine(55) synthase TruB [Puniceicoccus vermicola]
MPADSNRLEGLLFVDKPSGMTSHDVVARVRRIYHIKKVGHAGTLDPMATGLLIILVGRATKASNFLMSQPKTYEGEFRLGKVTDSQDADGEVVEEKEVPPVSEEQMKELFDGFLGDQYQTPPMFSAKKIKGVPLYKLARKGQEVEREPRFVHIKSFDLLDMNVPDVKFRIAVSKGTYVRTVAHDLGQKLGCGAYLTSLRRTAINDIDIKRAVPLETLQEAPPSQLGRFLIPVHQHVPSHVI